MLRNNKFKIIFLGILIFLVATCEIFSQTLNDFRTTGSGPNDNWTTLANWEIYDDVSDTWVAPTYYPGAGATNDVSIIEGHTITLNINLPDPIKSVTIGDQNEANGVETLEVDGNSDIVTTLFTIAYDGFVTWTSNGTLNLLLGVNIVVEPTEPSSSLVLGTTHGLHEQPSSNGGCNPGKRIRIGGVTYSTCSGGGGGIAFETVNDNGGNLNATPTASPSPTCRNKVLQLTANPTGTELLSTASYTWIVTPPSGSTYILTGQNPTDTPTGFGTYIYELTIENSPGGLTSTKSIIVEVESCRTVVTNRRITYRVNGGSAVATFGPTGPETNIFVNPILQDSNNGTFFQIQFNNQAANNTSNSYEIFLDNVPYELTNFTFNRGTMSVTSLMNTDGTYDYLISDSAPLTGNQEYVQANAVKSSPQATSCNCATFHLLP